METIKNIEYYMSLHYPVTIVKEDDGSYFIEYPDLEGCFSCGETIEDALQMGEGTTLVTHNVSEFSRVDALRIEDWTSEVDYIAGDQ